MVKTEKKGKKGSQDEDIEYDAKEESSEVETVPCSKKDKKGAAKKNNRNRNSDLVSSEQTMVDSSEMESMDVESTDKINKNVEDESNKQTGRKSKKSKKKRNDSDEDIDKVLAELELEYSGEKPKNSAGVETEKIKTVEKEEKPTVDNEDDKDDQGDQGENSMKTAAQKKKEKKERQKRAAAMQNQGILNETTVEADQENLNKNKPNAKKSNAKNIKPEPEAVSEPISEEHIDNKKSTKKTKADKKTAEKEKEKTKKKGISSAMVLAMQERIQKVKEEEERLKREEELRIQQEEEQENYRLEQLRLEAERKEKKKQREHERKARLKAEGKLLTAKQKQDKARAHAMLEALRAQGIELPEIGEKRPRPGTRVRATKKKTDVQQTEPQEISETTEPIEEDTPKEVEPPVEEVETVKDAWDASSSENESEEEKKVISADENDSEDESDGEDGSSEDESEDSSDDGNKNEAQDKREKAMQRITERKLAAEQKCTTDNLRAAVVCVLGHVDTGKTKILDKLRRTNVQDGEAGGITQQIGATNVPIDAIKEQTRIVKGFADMTFKLPGLLIIDTPGHESFSNLRSRGSSLCDIAILVVDIMHGLEPQTIESINLLKSKKTPFVVALNKIDRLYNWETMIRKDVREVIKNQAPNTQLEFQQRTKEVILQFAEQGLNSALFYENPEPRNYVNLIPTSAITGEGMGNLLFLIVESCQSWLAKRLMYSEELLATVLEVKAISGLGTTIDAILINGKLREGETMVIAGTDGPIVTQIRSLLMPQPMKELRVKNAYIEYKEIIAAQGVKIAAKELEKAIAGLNLYVAKKTDEVEICREEVARELKSALSHIKLSSEGVYVQASTLGSLEALLEFLKTSKIPYANIRIGPVVKRDVMKASTMLVHESQYATILAFDVKIERDAQDLADSLGVKIFQADIIYHLFDQFTNYRDELNRKKREEFKSIAVFPCKIKILPQFIFNSRDPIVMGVMIEAGIVKEGTPICVPSKEFLDIGIVTSIECNHKQVENARKGQEVCIKIEPIPGESPKMFGRHFDETDILTSKISRQSIDACKDYFRDDLLKADWALMVELKKLFQIL